MAKTKVAVLFGGRSVEHEVSRNSAYTVAEALKKKYDLFPIGISKEGEWYGPIALTDIKTFTPERYSDRRITVLPNPVSRGKVYSLPDLDPIYDIDVFFPVLHGTYGEDGTIQGLLDLMDVPYVGANVLASSLGMDKLMMKRIFEQAGLPQVAYLGFARHPEKEDYSREIQKIERELGYPCFVKPHNLGSSVGVSKASNREDLAGALSEAFKYSEKVVVEKGIEGQEVEVSVLGNENPQASVPGEIVPSNAFYDYQAKYIDDRSVLHIPARVSPRQTEELRRLAVLAFQAVGCTGLARVDFFVTKDEGEVLVNEINTMPGFTSISMYPKLWEYTGLPLAELTQRLVELAEERSRIIHQNVKTMTI